MEAKDRITTDNESIKSRAIVKYSLPKPAKFIKLQCNTDLNLPPTNWLSNSGSYGFQHILYQHKDFSSFRMAHMFPDCVGSVDVVSDSENIKNLLKIPYNKGQISMMVHRVENTLLLDNFDIYKHLLRTVETDWKWLRKFIYETIESDLLDEEQRSIYVKKYKSRKALKQKHLVSKFLYHSLGGEDASSITTLNEQEAIAPESIVYDDAPLLPDPRPEVPEANIFDHQYNRNVLWTFEDIEMLIGTDMPIFGGGTHPCLSLRLGDMKKPISVLTGIDYWLDNLMSNVPELLMCYHLNGIVQKYELIKTEDLPRMTDSKFSPNLIRDVAQSILSFLKSNATKAGHTYWLFKGRDEEVVKLYDLTSLSCQRHHDDDNPFTVPVAMLLYRMARNMKYAKGDVLDDDVEEEQRQQSGTIKMLLKNCLKLLQVEKYPEIVTSSHYMLADLYIPYDTCPENPQFVDLNSSNQEEEEAHDDDDEDVEENEDDFMKMLSLNAHFVEDGDDYKGSKRYGNGIRGTLEERCLNALQHIACGLDALKHLDNNDCDNSSDKDANNEEEMKMANSSEAIPMPFNVEAAATHQTNVDHHGSLQAATTTKKKKSKRLSNNNVKQQPKELENALLIKATNEAHPLPKWQANTNSISWKQHLKLLLYEKTILCYAIRAEYYYKNAAYGACLRSIGLLTRAINIMQRMMNACTQQNGGGMLIKENCVVGRAGDCCVMIVQHWCKEEQYRNEYHRADSEEDVRIVQQYVCDEQAMKIDLNLMRMKCVLINDIRTIEQMLLKAVECYQLAMDLSATTATTTTTSNECLQRRLGNSLNEIGSFYLNKAKTSVAYQSILDYCAKSELYLKRSCELFERVKDDVNVALVYTNIGHLQRLLAHTHSPPPQQKRGELLANEKQHYAKAFINYSKALQVIGERKYAPNIWDTVKWELSTAMYTMATILHEHPSTKTDLADAEKEVIETLQKALKCCDMNEENPKYPLYQYRAATIHYRLGSLYHNHILSAKNNSSKTSLTARKTYIQLSRLNYEKAAKLFHASNDFVNYLTSQMQRFALTEYLSETTNASNLKLKHLQSCLDILIENEEMIALLAERKIDVNAENVKAFDVKANDLEDFNSCNTLLLLVKQRLQYILRVLIKLCMGTPPINKNVGCLIDLYKYCYNLTFELDKTAEFYAFVECLMRILSSIKSKLINARVLYL